jgi:hypothetical protein
MKAALILLLIPWARAGDFDPAAGQPGSLAIPLDDPRIQSWATEVHSYHPGADLDETWQDPTRALGPATGDPLDITGLGRGGDIEFVWTHPLTNGPGPDIAIFENSFSDRFLELAHVEVSSDGLHWQRFPSISQTAQAVGGFGTTDPTNLHGLAGKYRAGFGTGFDFSTLPKKPLVDREAIRFVRLIDVVGDGSDLDSLGHPIYDPYPTFGSAGLDLDGVAVLAPPPLTLLKTEIAEASLTFTWAVEPGKTYQIETSPDLSVWSQVTNLTPVTRQLTHSPPRDTAQFLRLRELAATP